MGRVKKSLIALLFSLILILVFSSFSFAATGIVLSTQCVSPSVSLLYMNAQNNAHASTTAAAGYVYTVCYNASAEYTDSQILHVAQANLRTCSFGNEIVSLSSPTNAHVEGPTVNTYDYPVCYDNLNCRVVDASTAVIASDEQAVARLSANTDAHISNLSATLTPPERFTKLLICKEPICDNTVGAMGGKSGVFPLISDFNSDAENLSAIATGGANAVISSAKKYTGDNSLKLSYAISSQLENQGVTLFTSNKNNWSGYDYLEFYLYVEKSLGLSAIISTPSSITTIPITNVVAPLGLMKNKWNLIQIPVATINGLGDVRNISFVIVPSQNGNFIAGQTYNYYIDSMSLSSVNLLGNFAKSYCLQNNNTNVFSWSTSLQGVNATWLARVAPNATLTPSGKVCGEQPAETYVDGKLGCFNSNVVANGSPISYLSIPSLAVTNKLCVGTTCSLLVAPLSASPAITASSFAPADTNAFTLLYYNVTSRLANLSNATNPVENVLNYSVNQPTIVYGAKITFASGSNSAPVIDSSVKFYSCGGVPAQYTGSLSDLNDITPGSDSCISIGQYACSADGKFTLQQSNSANGYKCVNGQFIQKPKKQNYNGLESGYCALDSQCFITNTPTASKPSCIDSGNFTQNYYCAQGNWTSRTAILASQLLDYSKTKYLDAGTLGTGTLYCDHYSLALNVVNSTVENIFNGDYVSGPTGPLCKPTESATGNDIYNEKNCVNSFCVFAPVNKNPIYGTSLNKPFGDVAGLSEIFSTGCVEPANVADRSKFMPCTNPKYLYRADLQLVLYDPNTADDRTFVAVIFDALNDYIFTPIKNFFSSASTSVGSGVIGLSNESKLFSTYYYTKNENISVTAFYEVRYNETAGIGSKKDYYVFNIKSKSSLNVNLCDSVVATYNKQLNSDQTPISCTQTTLTSADVDGFSGGKMISIIGNEEASELWSVLTANLRP